MAYQQGVVSVPDTGNATLIATPGPVGMVVQNLSTSNTVFLGGPTTTHDATATGGVVLGTASLPTFIPGRHPVGAPGDVNDALYGVASGSGTANVAFVVPLI